MEEMNRNDDLEGKGMGFDGILWYHFLCFPWFPDHPITASLRAISSAYASAERNGKLVEMGIGHQNPATTGESEENYIKLRGKIKEFDLIKKFVKMFGTDMN